MNMINTIDIINTIDTMDTIEDEKNCKIKFHNQHPN